MARNGIVPLLAALFLCACPLRAQFYLSGSDAGNLKWSVIETSAYSIIYPRGADSLATVYARKLEQVRIPVGRSAGFAPNEMYRRRMPVVMHVQTANANGLVTWTPRRMELLTIPDAYAPEPIVNENLLALHESRHVAQMQIGAAPCYKGWNIVFGELVPGFVSGIYPGRSFLEGDAVLAETALTDAGRGRSADFLEYFRSCSGKQTRSFWQWRHGSLRRFTPDYYSTSYIGFAGTRAFYGLPEFTADYFHRIEKHHGWTFGNIHKTLREEAGTSLTGAYSHILDSLNAIWAAEDKLRAPFVNGSRIVPTSGFYKSWTGTASTRNGLLTIREGLTESPSLVHVDSTGKEIRLRSFSNTRSRLRHCPATGRTWWSEFRRDPRWELRSFSEICSMDSLGRVSTLTHGARLFNPSPSEDGALIAATSYPEEGGSEVVLFATTDGTVKGKFTAPAGMQVVETAWLGEDICLSAITDEGFGLYVLDGGRFNTLLPPQKVKIKQLDIHNGSLLFVSDHNGVNELYRLDGGTPVQLTSTRNGASDFAFLGDCLYYSVLEPEGRTLWKTSSDSLLNRPVEWEEVHRFAMAEEVSAAETESVDWNAPVEVGEPKPYRKGAHLFSFHSWAPVYVNYDAVSSLSLSSIGSDAGLGATAFWQNSLGTSYGFAGVNLFDEQFGFNPSFHAKWTWAGWYPVFEAGFDFGGRKSRESRYSVDASGNSKTTRTPFEDPYMSGKLKVYVPLTFSAGGISNGLIPQVQVSVSNDGFHYNIPDRKKGNFVVYGQEGFRPLGRITASVRGYSMRNTAASCIYPKLGIGAEIGGHFNINSCYCPSTYGLLYGYLPGIGQTHGIKLSVLASHRIDNGGLFIDTFANTLPRGFNSSATGGVAGFRNQARFTFDYALPFASLEWGGLCPLAYLRNLELIPHFDFSTYGNRADSKKRGGSLFSAGASLAFVVSELLRIPGLTRIGVDFSCNGGSLFDSLGDNAGRTSVEMVLNVEL